MGNHKLKLYVKQGEVVTRNFTITQDNQPFSLLDYSIRFQVKNNPYEEEEPIIDKLITLNSDINTVGVINNPSQGKFVVKLNKEDTSLPVTEYFLIISLVKTGLEDIISSNYCNDAKYIVCTQ